MTASADAFRMPPTALHRAGAPHASAAPEYRVFSRAGVPAMDLEDYMVNHQETPGGLPELPHEIEQQLEMVVEAELAKAAHWKPDGKPKARARQPRMDLEHLMYEHEDTRFDHPNDARNVRETDAEVNAARQNLADLSVSQAQQILAMTASAFNVPKKAPARAPAPRMDVDRMDFIQKRSTEGPVETGQARRAAIVSGGTRGIGRGIAESLAADGFDLLLTFNADEDAAKAAAAEIRMANPGRTVVVVGGDVSLEGTRDAIFNRYDEMFKGTHELGAVVHNAGQYVGITSENADGLSASMVGFGDGSLLDDDGKPNLSVMKYYQRMYGDAYVDLCERGLARMSAGGSLIGISSPGCSTQYNPNLGYDMPGSGKCVMEYAMRLFALRAAAKDVNCNVVVPGFTSTDAWGKLAAMRGMTKDELVTGMASKLAPMGSMQPRQLGDAVAFLCSPEGRLITGVSLPVDGGVHLKT